MKPIKMWETEDGSIFKDKEEGARHEAKIKISNEVAKFLKERLKSSPAYSINSHKDVLVMHWKQLKKWFEGGGPADEGMQAIIYGLCMGGLDTEGETHKQWFLEEILKLLVDDVEETHSRYEWLRGTEPPYPTTWKPSE